MDKQQWIKSVDNEIAWWTGWIETQGLDWPHEYRERTDPLLQLSPNIAKYLGNPREISVLDVGSGPMTSLGKRWAEYPVHITACDALADEYAKLPYPPGLPLVSVVQCDSERLSEVFDGLYFDLVHARNTLDHGYDPMQAIREMMARAKPGGVVILDHWPNEATNANHTGLHQFDFFIDRDRLMIKGENTIEDAFEELRKVAQFEVLEVLGADQCLTALRKQG